MGGRRRAEKASKNVARTDWGTPLPVLECVRECGPIGLDPCTNESSVVYAKAAYFKSPDVDTDRLDTEHARKRALGRAQWKSAEDVLAVRGALVQRAQTESLQVVEQVIPGDGLLDPWHTDRGSTYVNHPFSAEMVECWDGKKRRTNEAWARRAAQQAPSCPNDIFVLTPANPCSLWWKWYWDYASLICFWDGRLQFLGAEFTADFEVALVWFQGDDPLAEAGWRLVHASHVGAALAKRGRVVNARTAGYAGSRRKETP